MPTFRDRTCTVCGDVEYNTATHSDVCIKCSGKARAIARIEPERKLLEGLGYTNIELTGKCSHGKREWTFTHDCGTTQTWILPNIRKRLNEDPSQVPCSKCGGKRRMSIAMQAFIDKYGITPEQMVIFKKYQKKVRHLSDKVYKEHINEINPLGLPRGKKTNHLDHKMPIIQGFKEGLTAEFMARKENLQMLSAFDNLSKGRK